MVFNIKWHCINQIHCYLERDTYVFRNVMSLKQEILFVNNAFIYVFVQIYRTANIILSNGKMLQQSLDTIISLTAQETDK